MEVINISQGILEKQNVMIHFDDAWIPKGRGGERVKVGHI